MKRAIIPVTLLIILVLSGQAFGQITSEQIDSLRAVGEREGWTFTVSDNPATKKPFWQLCGAKAPDQFPERPVFQPDPSLSTMGLPSSFDWRTLDGVTPVKNQGACGSCWAYATVGALEGSIRIKDGIIVDLSEQYLLSCNQDGYDCVDGGWWSHDYHLHDSIPSRKLDDCGDWGPVLEENAPYTGHDDPCGCPYEHAIEYSIQGWGYVGEPGTIPPTDLLKQAIMQYGPISVAVYCSNSAFSSYSGGVYNACYGDEIDHCVVLVGWDDNQGENGVWIMKNSWGMGWGEDGYMLIEYGCNLIGYGATYVDYGLPPLLYFWGDSLYGPAPHTVNFDAFYPDAVDAWSWDFGDGESADIQAPGHTFDERGSFDVSVEVFSGGEYHSLSKDLYIVAIADTLKAADVYGQPGDKVVMTLTTFNSAPIEYFKIPVEFASDFNLTYDSFSTLGCRTEYFEMQEYLNADFWFEKRFTLKLVSSLSETSPDLPPGEGPIAKLYFTIPGTAVEGQSAEILLDGYNTYLPLYSGDLLDYGVPCISGRIIVGEYCCVLCGDADHNGAVNMDDIIALVDWTFASGPEPSCRDEAEIDGTEPFTIEDLVYLVNYVYNGGPAPAGCP